ncbi:PIG-L family deacetylase [Streptomyces sp. SAJ15]|uniref:PIG-L family deacetylase n=1 Tax=Streptomyces sp. SAJ15 TaxID=2011095 RepID=UPI0011868364|nr:PIG-L family deacetylase [Streptomyces sp. SAJ15]TVL93628.1 PIG-L family deacetylase [Streptomyces sp. SAJ15]
MAALSGEDSPRYAAPRHTLSRRRTLGALAAVTAATVAGCSSEGRKAATAAPVRSVDPHSAEPFRSASGSGDTLLLQVLAHPDDDLYFMNPDAQHILRSGTPVVSVYVTAGEAKGINRVYGGPIPKPDKPGYSSARHQGLRQAYAEMLGLDRFTRWRRSVMTLPGGLRAESNVLTNGRQKVQLVFLNIAMLSDNGVRVPDLWEVPGTEADTLVATGSPLQDSDTYDHEALVDVLAGLMDRFRPTVIHTLDPDPDFQIHDATHPRDNDQPGCSDHRDHTPVALFTWKAISQWVADASRRDGRAPRFVTTAFRGYYNQRWPHNLPIEIVRNKAHVVSTYGGSPTWPCGNTAGCGDYSQGGNRPLVNRKGWVRSTHHRYPGALPAPQLDRDGRLIAYGVLGTQAVRWRETGKGTGRFGAPENLGGGPLAPALHVVRDTAGRQLLFGLRFTDLAGQGGPNRRDIVVLEQRAPGGSFRPWRALGTPELLPSRGRRVGAPTAVATPDGRVHLFVRTADKGIATRVREADGRWGPWQDLGGGEIQDGLSALVDREGRIHVFGGGRDTVHHWSQDSPGGPVFARPLTGLPRPGNQPGAALAPDGSVAVVYRAPATAQPAVHTVLSAHAPGETPLRFFEGYGPVTAHTVRAGGRDTLLLLSRAMDGEVQLRYGTKPGTRPLRSPGHLVPVGAPTLLPGDEAHVAVVGMSPAATPWIWRPQATSRA